MRHDETWKLETERRQHIQVSRLSQERDMKNHVSRQDTCLETPLLATCFHYLPESDRHPT